MADIIQLLPDSIANQIAAGEVIQRPASVVKELMENAIDAGAENIRLIIKESGKTSIQVTDDGRGMSETDARLSFERHATSKIRVASDLFCIRSMGFRGEALASIAAIAHVEMITRPAADELATRISIEGSRIVAQEKVSAMPGTSITVKNLFYNVPARRKFLKSDPVELKHIYDEFQRVVLSHPEIGFTLHHNGNEIYHLPKGNLKQRIIGVFGKQMNEKLLPVSQETEIAAFTGFIGKPDAAKKTAGDQYIFVNRRFIRSHYLNHAIRAAFEELLPREAHPFYVVNIETDPATIDINIHPTKTEIKFEDERLVYNYLKVTLKHSLGQYHLGSVLDFELDANFASKINSNGTGRDFSEKGVVTPQGNIQQHKGSNQSASWMEVYSSLKTQAVPSVQQQPSQSQILEHEAFGLSDAELFQADQRKKSPVQIHDTYIMYQVLSGVMVVDQQAAHERILYESYLDKLQHGEYASQKELFPRIITLDPNKSALLSRILDKVNALGFEMETFGNHEFIIHGVPAGLEITIPMELLVEKLIHQYTENLEFDLGIDENLARSMAVSASIKRGQKLDEREMKFLIDRLFGCNYPYKSPSGKNCFLVIELEELNKRFNT
jgi:DNA mismatch repair protein MutL